MALIKCFECGKEISSMAANCPNCGAPIRAQSTPPPAPASAPLPPSAPGQGYVDKHLLPGEVVVYRTKLHWSRFIGHSVLALLFLGAAIASLVFKERAGNWLGYVGIAFALAGLITLVPMLITYLTSEFAVTNKRVVIKVGFVQRNSFEVLLNKVESILVEQGIVGRMLGYGTLVVIGTGGSREEFDYIANPLEFRRQVQSQIAG